MSSAMKFLTLVVVLNVAYNAKAESKTCNLVPMKNFNVEEYMGKWYEQRRYVKVGKENPKCVSSVDTLDKSGDIDASFSELVNVNGKWTLVNIQGKAKMIGDKVGKFELTFGEQYKANNGQYYIVGTDYTTFYVTATCVDITGKGGSKGAAWIYTREANPPMSVVEKALKVAEEAGFVAKKFFKISHMGCNRVHSQQN